MKKYIPDDIMEHLPPGLRAIDIDAKFEHSNKKHWNAYIRRTLDAENALKALYARTARRPLAPFPEHVQYIRPFLSSTFRDFNAERDHVFKTAFTQVEKVASQRGLFFAPLDLRWGVTSDQSNGGEVIKICLEEIDRSRPFFVTSLGFRNGWALHPLDPPDASWVELLQKTFDIGIDSFPWVKDYMSKSVTELEILHGMLREGPDCPTTARPFVYMRTVEFLKAVPEAQRGTFAEMGWAEIMLFDLKRRVIEAGFPVSFFDTPAEWAELLQQDLTECIERDFPLAKHTPLGREIADHNSFARTRTRCFVGRDDVIDILDQYLIQDTAAASTSAPVPSSPTAASASASSPILLLGPSGLGKSSVLARWAERLMLAQDSTSNTNNTASSPSAPLPAPVLVHASASSLQQRYIGSTADSTLTSTLLLWLLEELIDRVGPLVVDGAQLNTAGTCSIIPTSATDLAEQFSDWLATAAQKQPLLLVIDGLDQLASDNDGHYLSWLPTTLPAGVKLVCSSTPGHLTTDQCLRRGFRAITLAPLTDDDTRTLCHRYLGLFGKQLDKDQIEMILASEHTRDPLYLTTLLQEVRVYGSYEGLVERIRFYLTSENTTAMFHKFIAHLEQDFDSPECPALVRTTLCLLACARSGLSETELKRVLNRALNIPDTESFPTLPFAALLIRLEPSLVDQHGLKLFSHQYLREAICQRYLSGDEGDARRTACREHLVEYFSGLPPCLRKVQELPWQLHALCAANSDSTVDVMNVALLSRDRDGEDGDGGEARSHTCGLDHVLADRLISVLTDLELFPLFSLTEFKFDLHKYWQLLEQHCRLTRPAKSYYQSLNRFQSAHPDVAPLDFAKMCHDIGAFLTATDRYNGADVFFDQAIAIQRDAKGSSHPDIEILTTLKANLLYRQGRYSDALPLYEASLRIVDAHKDKLEHTRGPVLRTAVAQLLKEQGQYADALKLYSVSLSKQQAFHGAKSAAAAVTMCHLAEIHMLQGSEEAQLTAMGLYRDALAIVEKRKGQSHPLAGAILSSLGGAYLQQGEAAEAKDLLLRALKIKEAALGPQHVGVCVVLNNVAAACAAEGDLRQALSLFQRALAIRERTQGLDHPHVAPTLCNMAGLYVSAAELEFDPETAAQAAELWASPGVAAEDGVQALACALTLYRRAVSVTETGLGPTHVSLCEMLGEQARAQVLAGMAGDAVAGLQRALLIHGAGAAKGDLGSKRSMAKLLVRQANVFEAHLGNKGKALEALGTACGIWDEVSTESGKKCGGDDKGKAGGDDEEEHLNDLWEWSVALMALGSANLENDKPERALHAFARAWRARVRAKGRGHPDTEEAKQWAYDVAIADPEEMAVEDFDPSVYAGEQEDDDEFDQE
jgi:tetratricopeptide (TPR) repeat protein